MQTTSDLVKASIAKLRAAVSSGEEIEEIRKCEQCEKPLEATDLHGTCQECRILQRQEDQSKQREKRLISWLKLCPSDYQNLDFKKLPRPALLEKVMKWSFNAKGLLLHGATGLGKSRCAWYLIRREYVDNGNDVKVITSYDLSMKLPSLYSKGCDKIEAWADSVCGAQILFLDDPFKAKTTDRIEDIIFAIVERRGSNAKPMIVTANDTGKTLASRLSEDRGEPLVRRLRDYCHAISFF